MAYVQSVSTHANSGTANAAGFSSASVAGHTLIAFIGDSGSATSTFTISDATAGTTWVQSGSNVPNTADGENVQCWIAQSAPAGTHILTITASGGGVVVTTMIEDSGGAPRAAAVGRSQTAPGAGAGAITPGSSVGVAGDTVYGFAADNSTTTAVTANNGTGIVGGASSATYGYTIASYFNTIASATTPTFTSTAGASDGYVAMAVAIQPAAAWGGLVRNQKAPKRARQALPGQQRNWARPLASYIQPVVVQAQPVAPIIATSQEDQQLLQPVLSKILPVQPVPRARPIIAAIEEQLQQPLPFWSQASSYPVSLVTPFTRPIISFAQEDQSTLLAIWIQQPPVQPTPRAHVFLTSIEEHLQQPAPIWNQYPSQPVVAGTPSTRPLSAFAQEDQTVLQPLISRYVPITPAPIVYPFFTAPQEDQTVIQPVVARQKLTQPVPIRPILTAPQEDQSVIQGLWVQAPPPAAIAQIPSVRNVLLSFPQDDQYQPAPIWSIIAPPPGVTPPIVIPPISSGGAAGGGGGRHLRELFRKKDESPVFTDEGRKVREILDDMALPPDKDEATIAPVRRELTADDEDDDDFLLLF